MYSIDDIVIVLSEELRSSILLFHLKAKEARVGGGWEFILQAWLLLASENEGQDPKVIVSISVAHISAKNGFLWKHLCVVSAGRTLQAFQVLNL